MGAIIGIAIFCQLFLFVRSYLSSTATIIITPLVFSATWFLIIEIISVFNIISLGSLQFIAIFWALLMLVSLKRQRRGFRELRADFLGLHFHNLGNKEPFNRFISATLVLALFALLLAGWEALFSPPNNWDSMTYHLPRIMHWLQNNNVNFYDAITARQLTMPPLGEYLVLVSFALANGGDYLANLVQYFFFIIDIALICSLSWQISKNPFVLRFTFIVATCTPIALAEASTTQVDLIATTWVLTGISSVVAFQNRLMSWALFTLSFSGSILLAAATKPTAVLFLFPVAVYLVVIVLRYNDERLLIRFKRVLALAGFSIISAAIGFGPTAWRTYEKFGVWVDTSDNLQNSRIELQGIFGNILRIALNNFGIPSVIGEKIASPLTSLVEKIGILWTDPSFVGYGHIATISYGRNEDYAANPFQLIMLLVFAIPLIFFGPRINKFVRPLVIILLGMIFIQASVLKWNLWTNRLMIPIFLLSSVAIAVGIEYFANRGSNRNRTFKRLVVGTLLFSTAIYGFFFVIQNQYRPIISSSSILTNPRENTYFNAINLDQRAEFQKSISKINELPDNSKVLLILGGDSWEYPFWALGNAENRLQYTFVNPENTLVLTNTMSYDYVVCVVDCADLDIEPNKIHRFNH